MAERLPPLQLRSGRLCLDFIGTNGNWSDGNGERIVNPARWLEWLAKAHVPVPTVVTAADLERMRELRRQAHDLVRHRVTGGAFPSSAVETINDFASHHPPPPVLAADGRALVPASSLTPDDVLAVIARDLLDLMTGPLSDRIRTCANPECGFYFADSSRPGQRRWCASCGAAAAAARYRRTRSTESRTLAG